MVRLEGAAARAQKQGHGVALELVSNGAEAAGEELAAIDLPADLRARLLRVQPEWTPPGVSCRRIGNDGESIGTSLARLISESTVVAR